MTVPEFALLIQAAGTLLLFFLFLLLYRKFHRQEFLEWIASWALLFIGLALQVGRPWIPMEQRLFALVVHFALVAHVLFLVRGSLRFRHRDAPSRLLGVIGLLAAAGVAYFASASADEAGGTSLPLALLRAGAYLGTAAIFATMPGSVAGRILLSVSFLLWSAERALGALTLSKFGAETAMPIFIQYLGFAGMFLEMMIAVGIIILLFEATQARLASEMEVLVHSEQKIKEMGFRDPLTGLYNRHHFNDVIRRELANVRRHSVPLSVLLVDVDRFKEINDQKGHQVGDEVLKFVSNYLVACLRESDFVFRWGGDEFLVLLPRTDEEAATVRADELGRRLPHIPGTEGLQPSLSVGWATHRVGSEFPAALAQADSRMYEMKVRGKRERAARERDLGLLS